MLVFFAARLGRIASKCDLTRFLRLMRCESSDPQPRHLGMQHGLNFLVQGCYHPTEQRVLRSGEYSLLDLERAHPNFATMHRTGSVQCASFAQLKSLYDHRCACCGSKEGERHFKNGHMVTALEKGHCDPRRPLATANCIPMCAMCNMVYRNHAVFNRRGFVVRWLAASCDTGGDARAGGDTDDASSCGEQEFFTATEVADWAPGSPAGATLDQLCLTGVAIRDSGCSSPAAPVLLRRSPRIRAPPSPRSESVRPVRAVRVLRLAVPLRPVRLVRPVRTTRPPPQQHSMLTRARARAVL